MTYKLAFITSRWNSKRLPGKALTLLEGKPLLQRVVDRVRLSKVDDVVVVTSENSHPIIDYCQNNRIPVFTGNSIDEEDLMRRLVVAGIYFHPDIVLRVWGDCPFLDPDIINDTLDTLGDYDYVYPTNYTNGMAVTAYREMKFERLYCLMSDAERWYWNYTDEIKGWENYGFNINYLDYGMKEAEIRGLNINYATDLADASMILKEFGENVHYSRIRNYWREHDKND